MLTSEYSKYLKITNSFLYTKGPFWKEHITADQLLAETFIFIHEQSIEEPITTEIYWKCIKKARSKMVKEMLNSNPVLRARHNYIVNEWRKRNLEKCRENSRKKQQRRAKEMGTYRGKVGAPKGKNHGKFNGVVVTPYGIFESSYDAAKAENVSHRCIQYRCKQSNKFSEYYIKRQSSLQKTVIST